MPNNRHRAMARARLKNRQRELRRNALMMSTCDGGRWDDKPDPISDIRKLMEKQENGPHIKPIRNRYRDVDALDPYIHMTATHGLKPLPITNHKIKMPRKLKKKMQKSIKTLESIFNSPPRQNFQIERAHLQRPDVNPLMAAQQKAFNDLMRTGECLTFADLPKPKIVEGETYQEVIDKGINYICAGRGCPPFPNRFEIKDISDKPHEVKYKIIIRDEVDKDNENNQ